MRAMYYKAFLLFSNLLPVVTASDSKPSPCDDGVSVLLLLYHHWLWTIQLVSILAPVVPAVGLKPLTLG